MAKRREVIAEELLIEQQKREGAARGSLVEVIMCSIDIGTASLCKDHAIDVLGDVVEAIERRRARLRRELENER